MIRSHSAFGRGAGIVFLHADNPTLATASADRWGLFDGYLTFGPTTEIVDEVEVEIRNWALDHDARSIGMDFGQVREVYGFLITPLNAETRIKRENLEVWLSDVNMEGNFRSYDDFIVEYQDDGTIKIRFRTPQKAQFAKLHSLFDERTLDNAATGSPTAINDRDILVKAYYFVRLREEFYTYDDKGNRLSLRIAQEEMPIDERGYTYYPNSDLLKFDGKLGYRYDANGNLIEKGKAFTDNGTDLVILNTELSWSYVYDPLNRLSAVYKREANTSDYALVASYTYNHKGERIIRTNASGEVTRFVFDQGGNIIWTEYADGSSEQSVWVGSKLFASVVTTSGGQTVKRLYATDNLGSTVMITDESGQIICNRQFIPPTPSADWSRIL